MVFLLRQFLNEVLLYMYQARKQNIGKLDKQLQEPLSWQL